MNKKAETGFYVGLAILSIVLVGLGAKVHFVDNAKLIENKPGEALNELVFKEYTYNNIENYLDFSFRFAIFSALNDIEEEVWSNDPKQDKIDELKNKIRKDFLVRIEKLKGQVEFLNWNVKYPEKISIELIENGNKFKAILKSGDELVLGDKKNKHTIVILHDNLNFEHEIEFDLDIFSRLYDKYSKVKTDDECKDVQGNELFDENKSKCDSNNDFFNFEVETKDLGLVKPVIRFKIEKPGEIEFTSE